MTDPGDRDGLLTTVCTAEPFVSSTPGDDIYGPSVTCRGRLAGRVWYGPLSDSSAFGTKSRITINGRHYEVISLGHGFLGSPSAHIEVELEERWVRP
jgi:hypothetical protein